MKAFFRNKHFIYPLLCWWLVVVWFFAVSIWLHPFDGFKAGVRDLFTRHNVILDGAREGTEDIILVAVDEDSLRHTSLKWPWKRTVFADLIRRIQAQSPRAVGFDFVYSGESDPVDDEDLVAALAAGDNEVLAYSWETEKNKLLPLSRFIEQSAAIGFVNKPVGRDGVTRHMRSYIALGDSIDFSLETKLLALVDGVSPRDISVRGDMVRVASKRIFPAGPAGVLPINFRFRPEHIPTVPAYRVLNGDIPSDLFTGKTVMIGATATLIHDELLTPLGVVPGVTVLINALSMLMHGDYLTVMPLAIDILIILVLGVFILALASTQPFTRSCAFMGLIVIAWLVAMTGLRTRGLEFDYFSQLFLFVSAFAIYVVYKYCYILYISNELKNRAVTDPLTRFFTVRYFTLLLDQKIAARENNICVVCLGVRDYRRLSRQYDFEAMKGFTRGLARFLEVNFKAEVKRPIFARSVAGRYYILVSRFSRERLQELVEKIADSAGKAGFSFGDEVENISLSRAVVFSASLEGMTGRRLFYLAENTLDELIKEDARELRVVNVQERIWDVDKADRSMDELEFLSIDLQERSNDLDAALQQAEDIKKDVEKAYFDVVLTLVKALEEKDTFTQGHSDRTAKYAVAIAREAGWDKEDQQLIYKAALLHDIGKIGIPETILHKKERLTDDDFNFIKRHPVMSVEILKPIKAFEPLLPMVLHHHEKFDGTGYPYGLNGDMIPEGAQILAVADCFDAITCGRGYKKGTSLRDGLLEIERCSGKQFNPKYVEAFKRVLKL
jgi:putative nucleotidyltransferase with HDIG domain